MIKKLKSWWHDHQNQALERRYAELHGTLLNTQREMAALGCELSRRRGTYFGPAPKRKSR